MSLLLAPSLADALREPPIEAASSWIPKTTGEFVWSKQVEICDSLEENRYTACKACHGPGKSFIAARLAAWWLSTRPVGDAFVVTSAPTDKQVKAILWKEIGRAHRKGSLIGRINLDAEWYIGPELVAYGRKPADKLDATDAATAFQGIHAKYVLVILDEACGIPPWLWTATDSLVTNENSRVLAIGNPDDPSSEFEKACRPSSGWNVIKISAFDLPCYTGEVVPDYVNDVLTGRVWVEERKKKWGEDSPLYKAKVLAEFPDVTDDNLFTPKMVKEAQELELAGIERGQFGADIARFGTDRTVIYHNRGLRVRKVYEAAKGDTMRTTGVIARAIDTMDGLTPVIVDVIGVGSGVVDRLAEQGYQVTGFNASERASEPGRFRNRRAEAYWAARELMEDGAVDLDPEDDELANQLMAIRWKTDSSGRICIESKDDMKKRGVASPDHADAFIMALVQGHIVHVPDPFEVVADLTSDLLNRPM